jgi:hypothetical protein
MTNTSTDPDKCIGNVTEPTIEGVTMDEWYGGFSKPTKNSAKQGYENMESDIYHDCGHRRRNTDKRRKQLPQASKTELPHTDSMSTNADNSPMTTINDNEVARLCPHCGGKWDKSIQLFECETSLSADYRTDRCREREARQKAENEVARLRELIERVLFELEKVPFQNPKLTAFTAHRLADRYREQLNQQTK